MLNDAPPSLDALPCAALLTDGEGRLLYGNTALKTLVGEARLAEPGVHLEDLLPPASRIFLQTHVWPLLRRTGSVQEIQLQLRGADGTPQPVLLNARCDAGTAPAALRVSWVFFVSAERRRFEAELLRTRQRLENLLLSANAGTWEWHVPSGGLVINTRWSDIVGTMPAGADGLKHGARMALIHPGDVDQVRDSLQALLDGQRAEHLQEFRLRRADGGWTWVQERGRLISSLPGGGPEWVFGTLVDISAEMEQRVALRRNEALLQRTNALAGVGGWELDLRDNGVYWSAQTCLIHGVPPDYRPQLGEALDFYPPEARQQIEAAVQRAIAEGSDWDLELPFVRRDGRHLVVHALGTVVFEEGTPARLVGALQDVTERHRLNQALRQAKVAAEAASEAKSMFLANMSHEIRTPMNAVIGIARLLADSALDEDQRQLLGKLQLAGRSLMAVIDDVLDLAKIEAGALALEPQAYRPAELLGELDAMLADQARAKGLRWHIEMAAEVPVLLRGDPQRLKQVLGNLLSNALKFTLRGEVSLSLARVATASGESLRLAVRDSGIGIAAEAQAQLFQPFVQAEASTSRRFGGTGLGLSISKRLVELMGGTLKLSSAPGQGSEFVVLLPLERTDESSANAPAHALPGQPLAGVRLLVVDDSEVNLEVARRLMEREGATVQCDSRAESALTRLRLGEVFDAVLMDIQMPDMDGLQATRQIRGALALRGLPVIALTAGALVEEQRRAVEAGMDDFLTKPLDPEILVRTLRRHIEARRAAALPAVPPLADHMVPEKLPSDWPQIEGIAAAEAMRRLAGDAPLFRRLLARLLVDHGATPWRQLAQRDLQGLVAELHKLRGSAGTLGARRIHALATAAEEGLRGGLAPAALEQQLDELARAMAALALAAQGSLEEPLRQPPAPLEALPLDGEPRYAELLTLLRQQDLVADQAFAALAPWMLQQGMDSVELSALQARLQSLEFESVRARLLDWRSP